MRTIDAINNGWITKEFQKFILSEGYLIERYPLDSELHPEVWVSVYRPIPRFGLRDRWNIFWHNIRIVPAKIGEFRFPRPYEEDEKNADLILEINEPYQEDGPQGPGQNTKDMEVLASNVSEVFGINILKKIGYVVPIQGGIECR